jgi:uncharacterized protein
MSAQEKPSSISRHDWSLQRRGAADEARHNEKVKEAIKDNLPTIISDGDIISSDPHTKKVIKIPMKSLEIPRIKYKQPGDGVGSGRGGDKPGDVVGSRPKDGQGNDPGAGETAGIEYYEAEFSMEEIQQMIFQDLKLPRIQPKNKEEIESEDFTFDQTRKKKRPTQLDLKKTLWANITRNAAKGDPKVGDFTEDDYRTRTWRPDIKEDKNAVVFLERDISGSMGEFEIYITKALSLWSVKFLESKYPRAEKIFIAHDTDAYETNEEQFFTRGGGGGTLISSSHELTKEIIKNRYPPSLWNIYIMHFSDGDNMPNDNSKCVELTKEMLDSNINQYAYIQIEKNYQSSGPYLYGRPQGPQRGLYEDYNRNIKDKRFDALIINKKEDVLKSLQTIFDPAKDQIE